MREILFRGKRVDNGEWVDGFYSPLKLQNSWDIGYFIIDDSLMTIEIDQKTVSQYTGLKDKNGTRIFEGDIVKYGGYIGSVEFSIEDVWSCGCCNDNFDGTGFIAKGRHGLMGLSACEVIGNIYDNTELLEVKE